jgi:hypothetical protein
MALTREQLPKDLETLTSFAFGQALEPENLHRLVICQKELKLGDWSSRRRS